MRDVNAFLFTQDSNRFDEVLFCKSLDFTLSAFEKQNINIVPFVLNKTKLSKAFFFEVNPKYEQCLFLKQGLLLSDTSFLEDIEDETIFYLGKVMVGAFLKRETVEFIFKDDFLSFSDIFEVVKNKAVKTQKYYIEKDAFLIETAKDAFFATKYLNEQNIFKHLNNGVKFLSFDGILIGKDVEIKKGATIYPNTILREKTKIGAYAKIGPNSLLSNCTIGKNSVFNASQGYDCVVEEDVTVGPFCHLRPNTHIKSFAHLGDFVEVKNSTIGEHTHVSHLTYVGDSDVGKRVNFGCGVVTVNYNGKSKNRCVIGDDAFIGCNTNLVAPVKVGKKGYTAAGSTIVSDVPKESLAIARARQVNKLDYNKKLRGD